LLTTSSPPPVDPDQAAAADDARRFWRSMLVAAIVVVAGGVIGLIAGRAVGEALRAAATGAVVATCTLMIVHVVVTGSKPNLAARFGLARTIGGDERENNIVRDTTLRVYSVTLIAVLLYSALISHDMVALLLCTLGATVNVVIQQFRARKA
jgi:hypothetical protein